MLNNLGSTRVQLVTCVAAWPRTTPAWYHAGDHAEFLVPELHRYMTIGSLRTYSHVKYHCEDTVWCVQIVIVLEHVNWTMWE